MLHLVPRTGLLISYREGEGGEVSVDGVVVTVVGVSLQVPLEHKLNKVLSANDP